MIDRRHLVVMGAALAGGAIECSWAQGAGRRIVFLTVFSRSDSEAFGLMRDGWPSLAAVPEAHPQTLLPATRLMA